MTHDDRSNDLPDRDGPAEGVRTRADRQHALFRIVMGLDELGLATWTHPLLRFLGRYDGIEEFAWDLDPVIAVLNIIDGYCAAGERVRSGRVADDVVTLPVLLLRAGWFKSGETRAVALWDPLEQSFLEFVEQSIHEAEWRLWRSEQPCPDAEIVKRYLLADYVRVNGFR